MQSPGNIARTPCGVNARSVDADDDVDVTVAIGRLSKALSSKLSIAGSASPVVDVDENKQHDSMLDVEPAAETVTVCDAHMRACIEFEMPEELPADADVVCDVLLGFGIAARVRADVLAMCTA